MHIVYLCNEYPPHKHGGIGVKYQTIARRLANYGWKVSVVGLYQVDKVEQENDLGVNVYRIPGIMKSGLPTVINALRIQNMLDVIEESCHIDIIEGSELSFGLLSKTRQTKFVIRMSGGHTFFSATLKKRPKLLRKVLERISFYKADAFCAVSHYVAETTRGLTNLGNRKITVLPNPVDTTLFKPQMETVEESNSILFVGTVTEKKGIKQLLEAMTPIVNSVPEAHLSVVGRDTIDPKTRISYTDGLLGILPSNLRDNITFFGAVPNQQLPAMLARGQVCVYPSHMEAQGIVVIEGMAMAKLVVASETGPGPELIQHEHNGLLCDPYDPRSIAENVIRGLTNPSLRHSLGIAARRTVEQNFSIDVMIQKNIAFYEECINNKLHAKPS